MTQDQALLGIFVIFVLSMAFNLWMWLAKLKDSFSSNICLFSSLSTFIFIFVASMFDPFNWNGNSSGGYTGGALGELALLVVGTIVFTPVLAMLLTIFCFSVVPKSRRVPDQVLET